MPSLHQAESVGAFQKKKKKLHMMWHTNEKVLKVGHLAVPADRTRLCFMISSRVYTSGPSTQPAAQKTDFSRRRWEKCGLTFLNAMLLFTL